MARQRMKAADRKRQIMEVAQRLFARNGYSQTTTAAIAQAAGVTEPILYRHFRSKRALFLQLLEELSDNVISALRQMLAVSDDPATQIESLVVNYPRVAEHFHEASMMTNRVLASLTGPDRRGGSSDAHPLLMAHYEAYEKLMTDVIAAGQKSGQFRDDVEPRVAAWYFIHAAVAFTMTRNLGPDVFAKKHFVPQSAKLLMAGILKQPK